MSASTEILERSEIRVCVNKNFHRMRVKVCLRVGASTEIRTPVLALKGLRPGPLDDGGNNGQILPDPYQTVKQFC